MSSSPNWCMWLTMQTYSSCGPPRCYSTKLWSTCSEYSGPYHFWNIHQRWCLWLSISSYCHWWVTCDLLSRETSKIVWKEHWKQRHAGTVCIKCWTPLASVMTSVLLWRSKEKKNTWDFEWHCCISGKDATKALETSKFWLTNLNWISCTSSQCFCIPYWKPKTAYRPRWHDKCSQ